MEIFNFPVRDVCLLAQENATNMQYLIQQHRSMCKSIAQGYAMEFKSVWSRNLKNEAA